ncbi:MAG TPA: hypothetical protein PKK23_06645 [Nitrospirales bacterium]|nr:hypothetical protein [Nitrospirales bacterium]
MGKDRIAKMMKRNKILRDSRGYKRPDIHYAKPAMAAPNGLRQQHLMDRPDRAWVSDITYIRTYEGWLYLAAAMDLASPNMTSLSTGIRRGS